MGPHWAPFRLGPRGNMPQFTPPVGGPEYIHAAGGECKLAIVNVLQLVHHVLPSVLLCAAKLNVYQYSYRSY